MATRAPGKAPSLEIVGITKRFGSVTALDDVSLSISAGSFHALLGENGAGKSTLAKCIMGFHSADAGAVRLNGREVAIASPNDARAHGIGMVFQHFTLVPSLTAVENLVVNRADATAIINWSVERRRIEAFVDSMPLRVPLDRPVATLSAGEKQKLEILKLLYLDQRCMILDEPTSVLTPDEAGDILGMLKAMARRGEATVLVITHRLREATAYADAVTILRRGRNVGGGRVTELPTQEMASLMIGSTARPKAAERTLHERGEVVLELAGLCARDETGRPVVDAVDLRIHAGEIVGIAGAAGNGQSALVEVLLGQRRAESGAVFIRGERFEGTRGDFNRFRVSGLPEEPLKNATVPHMTLVENLAFRAFDRPPLSKGWWLSPRRLRQYGRQLISTYRVEAPSPEAPLASLSGGNVLRAVLAREMSGEADILILANPCASLDFASVADTHMRIMEHRNRGAAVLLVSEDLDEVLELADRVAVMSEGSITYLAPVARTDRSAIARHMAQR